jgi:hypothetical protein
MDDICHIIVAQHVLNDYCFKQLVNNKLGLLVIFVFYDRNTNHKFDHVLEIFF